jgi:phage shock protein C
MKQELEEDHALSDAKGKRFLRSRTNRMVAGVAGGLAEYFAIDPRIVRIGWVIAGVMGWGIFAYVLCWIFVPEEAAPA